MRRPNCRFRDKAFAFAISAALSLSLSSLQAAEGAQQQESFVARPDEELLLLALRLDRTLLTDTLTAYPFDGSVLVPFGELMRLLDLAITVDPAGRTASGFIISEQRRFELDVDGRRAVVEGRTFTFDRERVEVHQDDLYIDVRLIGEWLPLDVTINLYGSLLTVTPRELLPMQMRAQREKMLASSFGIRAQEPDYPQVELPRAPLSWPFVDFSLLYEKRPNQGDGVFRHSTYLSSDLLWGEAIAFIQGTSDNPDDDSRISWGRRDPGGNLFGPLGATEAIVGESNFPGMKLVSRPVAGDGFLLTNYPLDRLNQFEEHTFRGELPPGWDVELYRNGALIAFERSRPDGRYEFENIPVLFGVNVFRLVFYGPQGQRREEIETYNVAQSMTPAGEFRYRLSYADPRGLSRRSLAQFEYGLSSTTSLDVAFGDVAIRGEQRRFGKASIYASRRRWFTHVDFVRDEEGGSLLGGGGATQFGNMGVSFRYADFMDGFESEEIVPRFGAIDSHADLQLSGVLGPGGKVQLPFLASLERQALVEGGEAYTISGSLSGFAYGLAATNRILGTWFAGTPADLDASAQGAFIVSRWRIDDSLRGEIGYDIEPHLRTSSLQLVYESRRLEDYLLSAGVARNLAERDTIWLAGVSKRAGAFGLGLNLEHSDEGFSVRALLNVGIARIAADGDWFTSSRSIAGSGAASVLVFRDDDGDGIHDPGEQPLEKVGFFVNRGSSPVETDASGRAVIANLPPYRATSIAISSSTLEDPYLVPSAEGFSFVPRPGTIQQLLFPVQMTGELTGTVYLRRDLGLTEAAGITIHLIDSKGVVLKEIRSEYDGFFTIPSIRPGTYILRVSPEQLDRIAATAPAREVTIGPEGSVLDGLDITVTPNP